MARDRVCMGEARARSREGWEGGREGGRESGTTRITRSARRGCLVSFPVSIFGTRGLDGNTINNFTSSGLLEPRCFLVDNNQAVDRSIPRKTGMTGRLVEDKRGLPGASSGESDSLRS